MCLAKDMKEERSYEPAVPSCTLNPGTVEKITIVKKGRCCKMQLCVKQTSCCTESEMLLLAADPC